MVVSSIYFHLEKLLNRIDNTHILYIFTQIPSLQIVRQVVSIPFHGENNFTGLEV